MPRINGGTPSSTTPISPRGNETPRNGNQGSSNTKHRSLLGSLGAALGSIGKPAATPALPLLQELAKIPRVKWAAESAIGRVQ